MFNSTVISKSHLRAFLSTSSFYLCMKSTKYVEKPYLNTFWHLFLSALLDLEIHRFSQNPFLSFHEKSLQGHLKVKYSKY